MDVTLSDLISKLIDKIESWIESIFVMLPNFAVAVLVVLLFALLAKLAQSILKRILLRFSTYPAINRILVNMLGLSVHVLGIFVALGVLELQGTVKSLLAGAGIVGLALGFAFQDLITNFISGVVIAFKKPYQVGDLIETNGYLGNVRQVNMRTTVVRLFQGQDVLIPNKEIFQKPIKNYATGARRIDLKVGISYGEDLEHVQEVAKEAIESIPSVDVERGVNIFYEGFGDSAINFIAQYWIDLHVQPSFLLARSEGVKHIKRAFDEHGITIPFPIRTLDFGIKGGKTLETTLRKVGFPQESWTDN